MSTNSDYDAKFYKEIEDGSRRSASAVIPHILRLFPHVTSVVDIGCGSGIWLAEFKRAGILRYHGVDFGVGVDSNLSIEKEFYSSANLGTKITLNRKDLCISLEVAEHIGAEFADTFVDNLTSAADRILFSAAVPDQLGHHHINEQAPDYWINKFESRGFRCFDVIRPIVWNDHRISWWYRQNMMIYINEVLRDEISTFDKMPTLNGLHLIHPEVFGERQRWLQNVLQQNVLEAKKVSPNNDRAELALKRLKKSYFWKLTRPFHFTSRAAKKINSQRY